MEWYEILISVLTGLATAIPLVIKLVEYVKKATKEKNWNKLLDLVMNLMAEAENKFQDSADRREWVLMMVKATSHTINYEIDLDTVDQLITSLCELSKKVNVQNIEVKIDDIKTE